MGTRCAGVSALSACCGQRGSVVPRKPGIPPTWPGLAAGLSPSPKPAPGPAFQRGLAYLRCLQTPLF